MKLGGHTGFVRLKLCKLSGPNEIVTQECLDENLIEIWPKEANQQNLIIDKYTINSPILGWGVYTNFTFL